MFSGVSALTNTVDTVFLIFLVTTVLLFSLIVFLMIFFVVRYNHKRHGTAEQLEGNTRLEIIWTVIPLFIVLGLFYFGWQGARWSNQLPKDAMEIKVIGSMWQWSFEYPNGKMVTELKVPVNKKIKLHLTAMDVLHSFYVPAFRMKEDTVPGMDKYTWFEARQIGSYDILCAEYCGLNHSYMLSKVVVVSQADFDKWYNATASEQHTQPDQASSQQTSMRSSVSPTGELSATKLASAPPPRGMQLLWDKGCLLCHATSRDADVVHASTTPMAATVGPTFQGLFGSTVRVNTHQGESEVVADEMYVRRSILDPGAEIVKGYSAVMPERPMTEQELAEIVDYLKEL